MLKVKELLTKILKNVSDLNSKILVETKSIGSATPSDWYGKKIYEYNCAKAGYVIISACPSATSNSGCYWTVRNWRDGVVNVVADSALNSNFSGSLRITYEKITN